MKLSGQINLITTHRLVCSSEPDDWLCLMGLLGRLLIKATERRWSIKSCASVVDRTMMWKILPFFAVLFVVGMGVVMPPPGGIQDINPKDEDFQRAMGVAVSHYNKNSHHKNIYLMAKVLKAQSQVVEGMNYIMTLQMGKTFCIKQHNTGFCPIIQSPLDAKFIICTFTVWDRPWLKDTRVMDSRCEDKNPMD